MVVVQVVVTRVPIKVVVTLKLGVIMTHRRATARKPINAKPRQHLRMLVQETMDASRDIAPTINVKLNVL